MTQAELERELAATTGESLTEIRRRSSGERYLLVPPELQLEEGLVA